MKTIGCSKKNSLSKKVKTDEKIDPKEYQGVNSGFMTDDQGNVLL